MLTHVWALSVIGAATAPTQGFEGTFTTRKVTLRAEVVAEQVGANRDKVFQLTLEQLIQLGAGTDTSVMQIKGSRLRGHMMEMPGAGTAYMLINAATGLIQTVIPGQRSYYEVSLGGEPEEPSGDEAQAEPTVEPLGRTQVIGGLRCTGYRVSEDSEVSLVWTTNDASFRQVFESQLRAWRIGGRAEAKALGVFRKYGFPVMTQALDEDGSYSVEVITLTRGSQPDSLFLVPAGYRKMTVPGR